MFCLRLSDTKSLGSVCGGRGRREKSRQPYPLEDVSSILLATEKLCPRESL